MATYHMNQQGQIFAQLGFLFLTAKLRSHLQKLQEEKTLAVSLSAFEELCAHFALRELRAELKQLIELGSELELNFRGNSTVTMAHFVSLDEQLEAYSNSSLYEEELVQYFIHGSLQP